MCKLRVFCGSPSRHLRRRRARKPHCASRRSRLECAMVSHQIYACAVQDKEFALWRKWIGASMVPAVSPANRK